MVEGSRGDLVGVFAAGKYETGEMASWTEGDWDADMVFGSGDLVAAFTDGGYELGPQAAPARGVSEPSSLVLSVGCAVLAVARCRYALAPSA